MWDGSSAGHSKESLVCAMSPALQFSVEQPLVSFLAMVFMTCVLKYYGFPLVKSVLRVF